MPTRPWTHFRTLSRWTICGDARRPHRTQRPGYPELKAAAPRAPGHAVPSTRHPGQGRWGGLGSEPSCADHVVSLHLTPWRLLTRSVLLGTER